VQWASTWSLHTISMVSSANLLCTTSSWLAFSITLFTLRYVHNIYVQNTLYSILICDVMQYMNTHGEVWLKLHDGTAILFIWRRDTNPLGISEKSSILKWSLQIAADFATSLFWIACNHNCRLSSEVGKL